jgi:tetratricopeptide (TPR) repeat protein
MTWTIDFDDIEDQLAGLQAVEGVDDRDIAEAVRNAAWRQDVPTPLGGDPELEDTVYRLAWLFFVRAPALDVRYFVLAPMNLDLVAKDARTMSEAIADLAELEDQSESLDTNIPDGLDAGFLDEHLAAYRENATLEGALGDVGRDELEGPVQAAISAILANEDDFRKLYRQITERFVEEFDDMARSGAFKDVMHGGTHVHDHDHHHDYEDLETAEAYLDRSRERYEHGDLTGAIDDATAALKLDDDLAEAYVRRGVSHAAMEELDEALDDFARALAVDRENIPALVHRGLAHYAKDDLDAARDDFDRAVDVDDESPEVYANRGIVRFASGDADGAMDDFDRAIELDPETAAAYANRAMVHRASGDIRSAIVDYQKALEVDDEYAEAHSALGFIFLEGGYPEKAIDQFDQAIEKQPYDATNFYNRGNAHAAMEEYDLAIEDYTDALELDDEDVESLLNRGLARLKQEDFRGAIDDWNRAIELDPYNPMPYAKRAGVWNLLDEPEEAAKDLAQALELAPEDWEYRDFAEQMLKDVGEEMGYDVE